MFGFQTSAQRHQDIIGETSDRRGEAFFETALATFSIAESTCGSYRTVFSIGETLIELVSAGTEIRKGMGAILSAALYQRAISETEAVPLDRCPRLKVFLWDSESSNTKPLAPPWLKDEFTPLGQVIPCSFGRFRAVYEADGKMLSMVDLQTQTAICWAQDHRQIPFHVIATPLRAVLSAWFSIHDHSFAHASSVCAGRDGVLIAGVGGAGKSSTALACVDAGLQYLGDDYCLVSATNEPTVCNVYGTVRVHSSDAHLFSKLRDKSPHRICAETGKELYFLDAYASEKIARTARLKAILLPRLGNSSARLVPATSRDGFQALTESSAVLFPYSPVTPIRVFAKLSRAVPIFFLELSSNRSEGAELIASFLSNTKESL